MIDTVYSIGYSGFSINTFIKTITANEISLIVDVRSRPYSQYHTDFNKDDIEKQLKRHGIYYRNYAAAFGARQNERKYYSSDGYLDFELFSKSIDFVSGFEKLRNSMAKNYKFALMCAEKDPINCHRTILVARAFHDHGYQVVHLLQNNSIMTQKDIETRMLEKYYPNRNQLSLFEPNLSENEYIIKAYRKRNKEIGYSVEDET